MHVPPTPTPAPGCVSVSAGPPDDLTPHDRYHPSQYDREHLERYGERYGAPGGTDQRYGFGRYGPREGYFEQRGGPMAEDYEGRR
jgi:hypothetical protein